MIKFKIEDVSGFDFKTPCVIVANHHSSSDAFLMGVLPPVEGVMAVKAWTLKIPLIGFVARTAGYLKMDQESSEDMVKMGCQNIRDGVSIVVFPEGTRGSGPALRPFFSMAFKIALETKVPIVPICITGNQNCPKRGSIMLYPTTVKIRIIPPVTPDLYASLNFNAFYLKNYLRNVLQENLDQLENRESLSLMSKEEILNVMPHRPPMLLIEKLLSSTSQETKAETRIRVSNPFLRENGVTDELIFPELVAQGTALNEAYLQQNTKQEGFIVSFKNFSIKRRALLGERLLIMIRRVHDFENITTVHGTITSENEVLALGEVAVWKK